MPEPKNTSRKKANPTPAPAPSTPVIPSRVAWLDTFVDLISRFGRYSWDLVGVLLITAALLAMLALTGLSEGTWLTPMAFLLRYWFGWGCYLFVAVIALCGYLSLRRRWTAQVKISLGRILELEGAAFAAIALLSAFWGGSPARAEAGLDGGVVGWALAEIPLSLGLDSFWRTVFLSILFLLFLFFGLGLPRLLYRWAEDQLGETGLDNHFGGVFTPPDFASMPVPTPVNPPPTPSDASPVPAPAKKKPVSLPAEFRKTFHLPATEPEAPAEPAAPRDDRLPPLTLLAGEQAYRPDERHINLTAGLIEKTLSEFGVPARVVGFRVGPTVTQYAVEPGFTEKPGPDGTILKQKVRVSQISALSRDLALALSAERLRIEAPVPGQSYMGIEVPNSHSSIVRLRPIMEADAFKKCSSPLAVALGRDVSGHPMVADLARMPHLLIAGTTGSGKSVCIAALTTCLIANNTPDDLRLAMIDPKMVELVRFNGIPHLFGKVETELDRMLGVLKWALVEMDHRYRLLESSHSRDIESYNRKMEKKKQPSLPRIVILIDELADLMMSAPDQTEHSLVRLAQMARATGIHLVVATQRPSTDVVTGLIKANFPARIAFTVASGIDSRVILDTSGAETLLGRGDMLFLNPEVGSPQRAQGVLVTDQEVDRILTYWQKIYPAEEAKAAPWDELMSQDENSPDSLVEQAITVVRGSKHASASLLQRRLRIGYPRAARLIDELEELGVVGPSQGGGREREVLIDPEDEAEEDPDREFHSPDEQVPPELEDEG